jgi:CheY-like chemotaxis protein
MSSVPESAPTILLVEDEEQVLRLAVKILEMRGYAVLGAGTGPEALILSAEYAGTIVLLLADLELDETMNGCQLARQLRWNRPGLRVLYTSGYPLDQGDEIGGDAARKETEEWMAAFLPKPFTPATLTEIVRRALAS